ncbi:hypothetical protein [Mesorhizobium amorphae]|uniref:Uncharacterized protein n=1 Tax=Mesorhizobium amorphae CCNWGS0123 TaxID=1082933 RepID=G6Y2F0_9HYPH|nr:hypothetical protein [Mesorhizobium amorphae]ANT53444.1 hypothetical protein A6B35_28000 [Mesorhizobium amorphae CCNWGS0123]EHH14133.1 hypothetical protein MEA186_00450 [Mesorhizobium amorphae CCNWGS0123]GLR41367.1 hypothetical protein GCM10007880_18830 [Mesorhizobium amorphae]
MSQSSVEVKIDEVWSVVLRRIVWLEGASQRGSADMRVPVVEPRSYRYVLRKRGRDFRSYETFKELVEGARFLAGKNWDKVALRVVSLIRDRQPDELAEPYDRFDKRSLEELKGIPHWL